MDAWCAVEATMTIENLPHLVRERLVFPSPSDWVQVPLTPGIEAAAGHSQLLAQPEHRKAVRQGLDQAKPLCGSCSHRKRKPCGLGKVRCRQPEKILFPPELTVLLAQPGQFSPLLAGELPLISRAEITTVNAGLANLTWTPETGPG
jgi:hypothetical protein